MSEDKVLTDEEIAKAILQNIEYSSPITYIDEWGNCKDIMLTDILDLIHRLQDAKVQALNDNVELITQYRKQLEENEELVSEIERLKTNLANEKKWGKIQTKQAEKETAREILSMFNDKNYITENELKKSIEKRYDVGVDYENRRRFEISDYSH